MENAAENTYLKNFCYLFVPFTTQNLERFPDFCQTITPQNGWTAENPGTRYLHRYVSGKLTAGGDYHFRMDPAVAETLGVRLGQTWYRGGVKNFKGEDQEGFLFQLAGAELFLFNDTVGILAFEVRFSDDDPEKIAAAQYYLRKITLEKVFPVGQTGSGETFSQMAGRLLGDGQQGTALDFFFYETPRNEKANVLTYVDVPQKGNYDRELFYLKWCYHQGFDYDEVYFSEDSENYRASRNTLWGFSVSAAVCMVTRDDAAKEFIEAVFQKNFREQYLTTYVLLLHQKYMMYLFLTKLSVNLKGNHKQLEDYKSRLYEFETHYMFSYISEVPQYQRFYTKVRKIFALEELFRDVQEPLVQLAELERELAEKKQRDHDYRINTALTTLSLLSVVSAVADATGIFANLGWLLPEPVTQILQLVAMAGVALVSGLMIARLIRLKKK